LNRHASRHAVALAATFVLSIALSPFPTPAQNQPAGNAQPKPPAAQPGAQPASQAGSRPAAPAGGQAQPQGQPQAQPQIPAAPKVDPDKVVLTVGTEKVTAGQIDALIADLPQQQQQLLRRAGPRMLADELVRIKLFSQEAQKRQLDKNPKVQRQLELTHDQILANALAGDVLRKTYEANKEKYEKVHARHILIRTPGSRAPVRAGQKELTEEQAKAKADELRKQITGGADFAELARKESDDTVSGAQGGDLNVFGHGEMVPEFEKVAFALKEGEVSQPVKTPFGYHIIQVQNILGFEDLQQEIAAQSNPQVQKLVDELKKTTPVQLDESYFGPAPQAAQPQGAPGAPGAAPAGAQQPPEPGNNPGKK
jgi:peptidyl-prolyl cis-trans isomerase C